MLTTCNRNVCEIVNIKCVDLNNSSADTYVEKILRYKQHNYYIYHLYVYEILQCDHRFSGWLIKVWITVTGS